MPLHFGEVTLLPVEQENCAKKAALELFQLYSPSEILPNRSTQSPRIPHWSFFQKNKALIYRKDKDGFYVYAKPSLCDTNAVIKYISRYLGRLVRVSFRNH